MKAWAYVISFLLLSEPVFAQKAGSLSLPSGASITAPQLNAAVNSALTSKADSVKVRVSLTGASYTIPNNTTWLYLTQSSTIATQTLVMPATPIDGQRITISTTGLISSLIFVGTMQGWTNGSQFPAGTAMEFGWDSTAAAWIRLSE